jgi:hypothetical protein
LTSLPLRFILLCYISQISKRFLVRPGLLKLIHTGPDHAPGELGSGLALGTEVIMAGLKRVLLLVFLFVFLSPAWATERVIVADFARDLGNGGNPSGWQLHEKKGKADYTVIQDSGIPALRLRSEETSFSLQKAVDIDPQHYPVISWKWKVTKLPDGGDFRKSNADDQAAQIFLAFSNRKTIAYLWDTTAPAGSVDDASGIPFVSVKAIVVRSGPDDAGRWITETRNVFEDYKALYGDDPPVLAGIRIQINSQHTATSGESFFADVVFQRN